MSNKTEPKQPDEYFQVGTDDPRLCIYVRYPLFKALDEFAKRDGVREQVGLLVGRASESAKGERFLLVEDAIESPLGDEKSGRLEESLWKRARRIAAARHPNRSVVGWFHTRPEGGLEVTPEETAVHKRFFGEESQVLYLIDGSASDRNFFVTDGDQLQPAAGFNIYGKPSSGQDDFEEDAPDSVESKPRLRAVEASSELQGRHLERTLNKILKAQQKPSLSWKDALIFGLLAVNAALILFRPSPPVQVDTSKLERGQSELSAQVDSVKGRIDKLEKHLGDLSLLDEQLRLAAGMEDIDLGEDSSGTPIKIDPSPSRSPDSVNRDGKGEELKGGAQAIHLYKVVAGDTLSVLVERNYPEAPAGFTRRFAEFNRLKAPDYPIFPGDTLKLPTKESFQ